MRILVAEYASAVGLGGTCELEGRAMLTELAGSFERAGHEVVYPTSGPTVRSRPANSLKGSGGVRGVLRIYKSGCRALDRTGWNAAQIPGNPPEKNTVNLGCSPAAANLAADKLLCTQALARARACRWPRSWPGRSPARRAVIAMS